MKVCAIFTAFNKYLQSLYICLVYEHWALFVWLDSAIDKHVNPTFIQYRQIAGNAISYNVISCIICNLNMLLTLLNSIYFFEKKMCSLNEMPFLVVTNLVHFRRRHLLNIHNNDFTDGLSQDFLLILILCVLIVLSLPWHDVSYISNDVSFILVRSCHTSLQWNDFWIKFNFPYHD